MTDEKCSWDTAPRTLEGLLESIKAQQEWEFEHKMPAPHSWNIMVTKEMFAEMVTRIISLEQNQSNNAQQK